MRVTLERKVKETGFFNKKKQYIIIGHVEFTEEEKHILNTIGIDKYMFREMRNDTWQMVPVPMEMILPKKGRKYTSGECTMFLASCSDEIGINEEEPKIREAFKNLKALLDQHSKPREAKETFEL